MEQKGVFPFPFTRESITKKEEPKKVTDLSSISASKGKEFIFRLRNGKEVGRAGNLAEFASKIRTVPLESIEYHFSGRQFTPWLNDLKQIKVAHEIEQIKLSGEKLRQSILDILSRI